MTTLATAISTEPFESDHLNLNPGSQSTEKRQYSIVLAQDFHNSLAGGPDLQHRIDAMNPTRVFIITEESLGRFGNLVEDVLSLNVPIHQLRFPGGESGKHLDNLGSVYNELIQNGVDRKSLLIGVGGGVVGDFAGFVASSILRGIPFVLLPTTLLAMVDSSVGGKVAVNTGLGKNMVGAFYHPGLVWCNLSALDSLPDSEWSCGLAEMAKHTMLETSGKLRDLLLNSATDIRQPGVLAQRILESVSVKAYVVARDEKESGLRASLNLGHTTAHGIESLTDYKQFSHGQAVSRGLVTCLLLSRERGMVQEQVDANLKLMEALGLPMDTAGFEAKDLWEHMKFDKKNVGGEIRFVLFGSSGLDLSVPVGFEAFSNAWAVQRQMYG
jgi:3-dehydroquinate synthase